MAVLSRAGGECLGTEAFLSTSVQTQHGRGFLLAEVSERLAEAQLSTPCPHSGAADSSVRVNAAELLAGQIITENIYIHNWHKMQH